LTLLVLLGLFLATRPSPDTKPTGPSIVHRPPGHVEGFTDALPSTWQAFRQELHRDDEPFPVRSHRGVGAVVSHYRLKDAYLEVN
jgi:hypothetical protein